MSQDNPAAGPHTLAVVTSRSVGAQVEAPRSIRVQDLAEHINSFPLQVRRRYHAKPELVKKLLQTLVEQEVMAAEARRRGLDKQPAFRRVVRRLLAGRLRQAVVADLVPEDISEQQIKRYYQKNRALFRVPQRLRVAQIVVKTLKEAAGVAAKAGRAGGSATWSRLVEKHSIDTLTRSRDGDLGLLTGPTSQVPKAVFRAALTLSGPGSISKPIFSPAGWHVLRLIARQEAADKPLSRVRGQIRRELFLAERSKRYDAVTAQARGNSRVEIFLRRLSGVKVDLSPTTPPRTRAPQRSTRRSRQEGKGG